MILPTKDELLDHYQRENDKLRDQLAAEREKAIQASKTAMELAEQLDAEREKAVKTYLQLSLLEKKLTAERESECNCDIDEECPHLATQQPAAEREGLENARYDLAYIQACFPRNSIMVATAAIEIPWQDLEHNHIARGTRRRHRIVRMKQLGFPSKHIARLLEMSVSRVNQVWEMETWEERHGL